VFGWKFWISGVSNVVVEHFRLATSTTTWNGAG